MLAKILSKLLSPIALLWLLRRHGGIWGLKRALAAERCQNGWKLAAYDSFFARHGSWIGVNSEIDGIPCFPHGYQGVFISGGAKIGKNAVIFQQVTIGSNSLKGSERHGSPTLGDHVYIGAGAKIIGGISVGDHCRIGANAVVYDDLPAGSVAVPQATRVIAKGDLDNRYFSFRGGRWVYFDNGKWIEDEDQSERGSSPAEL